MEGNRRISGMPNYLHVLSTVDPTPETLISRRGDKNTRGVG